MKEQFLSLNALIIFILQERTVEAFQVRIPGSRLPDWIRYQNSGKEVIAERPPNWFNSNFLGFGFSFVVVPEISSYFSLIPTYNVQCLLSYSGSSHFTHDFLVMPRAWKDISMIKLDHISLLFVPLSSFSNPCLWDHINWHQVTRIRASFGVISGSFAKAKRYGIGMVYSNEDVDHNKPPMIQFGSISSPSSPPNKATVVLTEIHEEEPSGSVDGSELDNSGYYTADEGEPAETACSKDPSESEMQPQKSLKCSHFQDIP